MGKTKSIPPKIRTTVFIDPQMRKAMLVIKKIEKVLPSHQMQLAIERYLLAYAPLLKKHGIEI